MTEDVQAASGRAVRQTPGNDAESPALLLLTAEDQRRLSLYKARYALEAAGLTREQVSHVLFLRWLHARGGLPG